MCGAGEAGQLGIKGSTKEYTPIAIQSVGDSVFSVACGIFHTCFITLKGDLYAMGGNSFGQLGIGNQKN